MECIDYRNKEWLYQAYIVEKLSIPTITKLCGLKSHVTIWNWLKRFEIRLRKMEGRNSSGQFLPGKDSPWYGVRGKNHHCWKDEKRTTVNGYVLLFKPKHPRANINGYVFEHILVAEKMACRPIEEGEELHHINGKRDDNREENLMVFPSKGTHVSFENRYRRKYATIQKQSSTA